MTSEYKPNGHTSVAPYLIIDSASRTIEFLTSVVGALALRRFPDPSGRLMHAEVRIPDTVVMLADSAEGWPPVASHGSLSHGAGS